MQIFDDNQTKVQHAYASWCAGSWISTGLMACIVVAAVIIFFLLNKTVPPRTSTLNNPLPVWSRPDVPLKVGIIVGHWRLDEFPDELAHFKANTGTQGGGVSEVELNLQLAKSLAKELTENTISVDILSPALPPDYWADVLIAIHADGNEDRSVRGFKVARPYRDVTGKADQLVDNLVRSYAESTNLPQDDVISANMRGYYSFNWRRYDHSMHPMSVAAIIETGFLTNVQDRSVLLKNQTKVVKGMEEGIVAYLRLGCPTLIAPSCFM